MGPEQEEGWGMRRKEKEGWKKGWRGGRQEEEGWEAGRGEGGEGEGGRLGLGLVMIGLDLRAGQSKINTYSQLSFQIANQLVKFLLLNQSEGLGLDLRAGQVEINKYSQSSFCC